MNMTQHLQNLQKKIYYIQNIYYIEGDYIFKTIRRSIKYQHMQSDGKCLSLLMLLNILHLDKLLFSLWMEDIHKLNKKKILIS